MGVIIIGRDNLLAKEIYPRINKNKPFCLVGQRGIGKTVILNWAYEHYAGKKILVNCGETYGHIIKQIASEQKTEDRSKKTINDLERDVVKGEKIALFVDEIEKATPKLIRLFKALNELWPIYFAGLEPFREEIKVLLWGKQKIRLNPINKQHRRKLAEACIKETGSLTDVNTLVNVARGIPARAWAIARGEPVKNDNERVEGEEINIAPMLLLGLAFAVIMRYVSRETGEKELYILGSIIMGMAVVIRLLIYNTIRKT